MKNLYTVSITAIFVLFVQFTGYSATIQKKIELKHSLFEVSYTPEGVTFSPVAEKMDWKWQLETISGIDGLKNGVVTPDVSGNDIHYRRGVITEQYLFRSFSVEQQFVIHSGELVTGDLVIDGKIVSDGSFRRVEGGWNWVKNQGNVFVGDVFVYDANGKSLQASMEVTSTSTRIIVDYFALKNASYPVTIDPQIGTDDFVLNNNALRAYQPKLIFNTTDNAFFSSWTKYAGSGLARNEDIYGGSFTRAQVRGTPYTVGQTCNYSNFRISKDAPSGSSLNSSATNPDVAYCGSNYLTVWEDYYQLSGNKRLINSRISSTVTTTTDVATLFNDATFSATYSSPRYPAVAGNNSKFLALASVYNTAVSKYSVLGKFIQANGTPEATAYQPVFFDSPSVFTDIDVDARPSGNFAIAASTLNTIYYGRADNSGNISATGSKAGLGKVGSVAISAKDNSNFLVVWSELTGSGSTAKYVIKGSINGGTAFQIDPSDQTGSGKPAVAYNPDTDSWLVAWHCSPSTGATSGTMVWAREVLPAGTMNNAFPVSKQTRTSVTPTVAYDSQNREFWIAWSGGGSKDQLLAQRWTNSMSDCIISMKRDTIHENNYRKGALNPSTDKYVTAFKALTAAGDSLYPLDFFPETATIFQTSYLQNSNTQVKPSTSLDDVYTSRNKLFYVQNDSINYEKQSSYGVTIYAQSETPGSAGKSSSQPQTIRVVDKNEKFYAAVPTSVTFYEDDANTKIPFTYNSGDNGLERNPLVMAVTVTPTLFVSAPTMTNPSVPDDGLGNVIPRTKLTVAENLSFSLKPNVSGTQTLTFTLTDQKHGVWSATQKENTKSYSIEVTVIPVNDAPTFTPGDNVVVNEDCGTQTITAWAGDISKGAPDESGQTLSFTVTTSNSTLFNIQPSLNPNTGDLVFSPAANANGTATLTVYLKDSGGTANGGVDQSGTVTFTITVNPVNDAPTFISEGNVVVNEDSGTQTVNNWASNISRGPDNESGQTLTFTVTTSNNALFDVQPDVDENTGTLTYTPKANAFGTATVTVTLSDNGGTANGGIDSSTQTFVITILPVNDAPVFTKGSNQGVLEDSGPQTVTTWATGIGPGNSYESSQTLQFFVSNDNNALFAVQPSISSTGTLTFTPALNANGTATVTVYLKDNGGTANGGVDQSGTVTFTVTINPVNDAPTFTKGSNQSILEDSGTQTVTNWASNISRGPSNESDQSLIFTVTNDNNSLFDVQPDVDEAIGTLTYTPKANAFGTATVTVTLSDNGGTANGGIDSSTQTFVITITPVNDAPVFAKGSNQVVLEDSGPQTVTPWATGIGPGNSDESSQTLQFFVSNDNNALFVVQPSISSTGTLTFTPASNAYGTATVSVRLEDNGGVANGGVNTTASETFTITVTPVNDAPYFSVGTSPAVPEDSGTTTVTGWISEISAGPTNENSQVLSIQVTTDKPELFSVQPSVNVSSGNLSFTPAANAFGTANLQITLSDDGGILSGGVDSYTQYAAIDITPVNDSPAFTPGNDQVILQGSGTQTVTSWATNISPGPANESEQLLSFNLTNTNSSLFSVQPAVNQSGDLTYTPQAGSYGTATVTVQLKDNGGTAGGGIDVSATATFTITILPLNHAPSFNAGADVTVNEGVTTQSVTWATNISAGPSYESGQTVTFFLNNDNTGLFSEQPAINSSTGVLTFKPADDQFGVATVQVYLKDNGGTANGGVDQSGTVTFTITVNPVNDAPTFTKGNDQTILEDAGTQTVTNWASDISRGPDNESVQSLSFTVTNDNNSLFDVQPDVDETTGTLTYFPKPDAFGTVTVTVTLSDNGGTANGGIDSSTQTFVITILPVNDAPVFTKGSDQTVLEDCGTQTVTAWATGIDPGNSYESSQTLQFIVSNDNNALFAVQPSINPITGTLTFTPASNAYGTATVSVRLEDNGGVANGGANTTASDTFTITVTPVNDAPSFTKGDNQIVMEDCGSQTVTTWATDISKGNSQENSQAVHFVVSNTNHSLFSSQPEMDESGNLFYTPGTNKFGTATLTVTLTDDGGTANGGVDTSSQVTVTITVNPVNDKPVAVNSTISMLENETYTFQPGDFGFSDQADPGDALSQISIISGPGKGTLSYNGTKVSAYPLVLSVSQINKLSFQPESFKFGNPYTALKFIVADDNQSQASNGTQWSNNQANLNIVIITLNQPPVGLAQQILIDGNSEYSFASQSFGFSDPDEGNQLGGIKIESRPAKGQLLLHGLPVIAGTVILTSDLPNLVFKPDEGEYGDKYALFFFRVGDYNTIHPEEEIMFSKNAYPFSISVRRLNAVPFSENKSVEINENGTYTFSSSDFALFDTKDVSDVLYGIRINLPQPEPKLTLNGKPVKNEAIILADSLQFMKFNSTGFKGDSFSFGFKVIDNNSIGGSNGVLQSESAYTFTILINSVNEAPVLVKPFADVDVKEFEEFLFKPNVDNFADPDGDQLICQVNIVFGNWVHKDGENQLEGLPLPGSDSQAIVTVRATDPQGLWVEDTFTVNVIKRKRPILYGQIAGSEVLPQNLLVGLYKYNAVKPDTVAVTNTGTNDYYYFEGVSAGLYLVKAINNHVDKYPQLVSTYYTSTTDWSKATKIDVNQESEYQANINMYYNQAVSGTGAISGYVKVSEKTSPPQEGSMGNPDDYKPFANVDIILTEKGSSNPVLYTQTASDGSYKFTNLPLGEYVVSVSVPGFLSKKSYTLKLEEGKLAFENINFLIYLGDNVITNNNATIPAISLNLYPNPTTGLINLVSNDLSQKLLVNVVSMNGQVVIKKQFDPENLIQVNLENLLSGTYLVEVRSGNFVKTFPVILMKTK